MTMVNRENVEALAAFVKKADYEFDMQEFVARPLCGSAGCIGGHAAVLWPELRIPAGEDDEFTFNDSGLADKLGIRPGEETSLCYFGVRDCTREMAVARLRALL